MDNSEEIKLWLDQVNRKESEFIAEAKASGSFKKFRPEFWIVLCVNRDHANDLATAFRLALVTFNVWVYRETFVIGGPSFTSPFPMRWNHFAIPTIGHNEWLEDAMDEAHRATGIALPRDPNKLDLRHIGSGTTRSSADRQVDAPEASDGANGDAVQLNAGEPSVGQ